MILTTLFKNLFKKRSVRSRRSKEHQHQQSITSSAQHQQQQQQTSTSYTATTKSGSFVTTPTSSTSNGQKKIIDGRVYHDREGISYIMPEDDEGFFTVIIARHCTYRSQQLLSRQGQITSAALDDKTGIWRQFQLPGWGTVAEGYHSSGLCLWYVTTRSFTLLRDSLSLFPYYLSSPHLTIK